MQKIKIAFHNNLANMLTMSRFLFTIALICYMRQLFMENNRMHCIVHITFIFIAIFISDFFDGRIARRLHIDSSFGAILDVLVDVIYVFTIHIQLCLYDLIPAWFLLLIAEKIINYIVTSRMLSKYTKDNFQFIKDPVGKIVSASYFVTPLLAVIVLMFGREYYFIIAMVLGIIGCFGIISSISRVQFVIKVIRENCLSIKHFD